jgi:hypothetical protein
MMVLLILDLSLFFNLSEINSQQLRTVPSFLLSSFLRFMFPTLRETAALLDAADVIGCRILLPY